jgi:cytochrome bd-type quinol oxidase subunit 1
MSLVAASVGLHLAQADIAGNFEFPGGVRAFTGLTMLIHMFFAELFVGFAIAAPVLQAWGARTGSPRMDRLAHSMTRFNVLTFSTGATFAVLFLVLLVGFYPRVTAALFTHFFYLVIVAVASIFLALWGMYTYYYKWDRYSIFHKRRHAVLGFTMGFFIWVWMVILTGIDTYMVTGGGPNATEVTQGNVANLGTAISGIFNPMFVEMVLHRTFANLSWPAFALAAWAAFMYVRSKSEADRAFYDWSTSVGLTWGVSFLLVQPIVGFAITYSMKLARSEDPASATVTGGAYERLTEGATSHLLYINLIMVVGLFVLSNVAMYLGAGRDPERAGRRPIQLFGLVAAIAGLYSISPLAQLPFFHMRYVMILIMVLATAGALVAYVRSRRRFSYGNLGGRYLAVLVALGVLAAVVTLSMGWMKSNSRAPYTIYGNPEYQVESERPVTPEELQKS